MELKVVLLNKTVLSDGRKGPLLFPFTASLDFLLNELNNTTPVPTFRVGNKIITKEFLEGLQSTNNAAKAAIEPVLQKDTVKAVTPEVITKVEEVKVDTVVENTTETVSTGAASVDVITTEENTEAVSGSAEVSSGNEGNNGKKYKK